MPKAGRPYRPQVSEVERRILWGVAAGKTNAAIGSSLGISGETVKTHLSKMYRRFGVVDRASLVYTAVRRGFLPVADVELPPS